MTEVAPGSVPRTEAVGACPLCGGAGARPAFESRDHLLGTPGSFRYRRCGACATVFQDPRVVREDLHLLYTGSYYTRAAIESAPTEAPAPVAPHRSGGRVRDAIRDAIRGGVAPGADGRYRAMGRLLASSRWLRVRAFGDHVVDELLPWRRPAGRALDVGCGSGKLMLQLARVGWTVEGAEWDAESARLAHAQTGLPVHQGDAASLPRSLGPFDLVVLSHVLEHLPRPVEALGDLRRLLSPGGRLVVLVPNPHSLSARWFGEDWYHWDAPRHLVLIPPGGMADLGARAGLSLRHARTLSRWAAPAWGTSRARGRGESMAEADDGVPDRIWAALETCLVELGAPVGEEIVAVFTRRGRTSPRPGGPA